MLTYVKDLGLIYPTDKSKQRYSYGLYLCSGCNKEYRFKTSQIEAGYTNWCKTCGMRQENKRGI